MKLLFQDRRKMMIISVSTFLSLALLGTILLLIGLFATWHYTGNTTTGALNWNDQYSSFGAQDHANIFATLNFMINTYLPANHPSIPSASGISLLKTAVAGAAIWFAAIPVFIASCYYVVSYILIRF